jgi:hypothetical protein
VFASEGSVLGKPVEHWEGRIADLDARGRAAWAEIDEVAWRRATNEAQALYETISTQLVLGRRSDDPAYLALRASGTRAWADRILRGLDDLLLSNAPEVRARQEVERESLRAPALRDKLAAALAAALGMPLQLELEAGVPDDNPARRDAAERQRRQAAAEAAIQADPVVRELLSQFKTARIVPGSIKPL